MQYVAHGDPPYLRIEAGRTGKDMKNYLATGPEFRKRLHFTAPTVVYVIGCNVGTVNAPFKSNDQLPPHLGDSCRRRRLHGAEQMPVHLLLALCPQRTGGQPVHLFLG